MQAGQLARASGRLVDDDVEDAGLLALAAERQLDTKTELIEDPGRGRGQLRPSAEDGDPARFGPDQAFEGVSSALGGLGERYLGDEILQSWRRFLALTTITAVSGMAKSGCNRIGGGGAGRGGGPGTVK